MWGGGAIGRAGLRSRLVASRRWSRLVASRRWSRLVAVAAGCECRRRDGRGEGQSGARTSGDPSGDRIVQPADCNGRTCARAAERERGRERDWVAWVCEICHVRACVWCVSVRACGRGDAPPAATVSARGRAWALPLGKSATTIGSLAGLCGFIGALGAAHLSRDSVGFEGGLAGGAGDEHKTL